MRSLKPISHSWFRHFLERLVLILLSGMLDARFGLLLMEVLVLVESR